MDAIWRREVFLFDNDNVTASKDKTGRLGIAKIVQIHYPVDQQVWVWAGCVPCSDPLTLSKRPLGIFTHEAYEALTALGPEDLDFPQL